MFHLVLIAPQVPPNTGAVGRLALATGSRLHLVRPLGFSLDDAEIRRRGLDYWKRVDLRVWENFAELRNAEPAGRFWLFSTKAERSLWQADFRDGDFLVFGPESRGLPEEWIAEAGERALRIPMAEDGTRSLNLASCAAVAVYEAWRQVR
jgi:tRNA (cytidine/uridine-2'-O-)-methyltransferase